VTAVLERYDEHQLRDSGGQWAEQPGMSFDDYADAYDVYDESATASGLTVVSMTTGEIQLAFDDPARPDRRHPLLDLDEHDMRQVGNALREAAASDVQDDWELTEGDDVWLRVSRVADGVALEVPGEEWSTEIDLAEADGLADAVEEQLDRLDELDVDRSSEPDDATLALLLALHELSEGVARAWNPGQERYPKGHPLGGKFRPLVDRLKEAIEHRASEGGVSDPLAGFTREQLRRAAKARGITLGRGESRDSIAEKLLKDLGPAEQKTKRVPVRKSALPRVSSSTPLAGGTMGSVDLVEFDDGTKAVRKRTRTWNARDEDNRPYRVTGRQQADAEELAAHVMTAVGARGPWIRRDKATQFDMEYIDGRTTEDFWGRIAKGGDDGTVERTVDEYVSLIHSDQGKRIGLADVLMNNFDRHQGNWLVTDDGSLVGIDHGLAWALTGKPDRAPMREAGRPNIGDHPDTHYADAYPRAFQFRDNDLTPADVGVVRQRLEALRGEFERLGRQDWFDYTMARLDIVGQHAKGTRNLIAGVGDAA
jgi:hypothetical protein